VKGAFESGAIVRVKVADPFHDMIEFGAGQFLIVQESLAFNEARGREASEIENDFQQVIGIIRFFNGAPNIGWKHVEEGVQIVCDF
jgi:hypothetical protein